MSKLKLGSIFSFLNKNKKRFMAGGLALTTFGTIPGCTYSIVVEQPKELSPYQEILKRQILSNIEDMEVYKTEGVGGYYLHQPLYEEAPGFTRNENGELVETDKNFIGYTQFFITFEEAKLMELTEILEARVIWASEKEKTK